MNLVLIDINGGNLKKAGDVLKAKNDEKTETYEMDVSKISEWNKVKADVEKKFPSVDLLMLNAGASPKHNGDHWADPEYFHKTYATNVFGPVNGIAAFLPLVKKTTEPSSIIITGSKQGITNPPGNPAYNSSKSMIKTITEHLSHDLRTSNPNISVHLLVPGWTFTGLSGNSGPVPDEEAMKSKKEGAWLPSQVAEYAYGKMQQGKFYIICPDNDVHEELDQARMTWAAGDVVEGRSALSRWDERFKGESAEWIKKEAERRGGK